jgi:hypothetical protein
MSTLTPSKNSTEHCNRCEKSVASRPTSARPGSAEKLAILAERFERGENLWHPADEQLPVSGGLLGEFVRKIYTGPNG